MTPPAASKPAPSVPKSTKNILNKSERALFEKNIDAVLSEFPSDLRINRSLPGSKTRVPSRQNIRSAPTSAHKLSPRSEFPRKREFFRPQRDVVVNKTDSTIQIFDNSMINENSQNESSNFDDSDFLGIFNSLQQTDDKQRTRDPSFEMSLPQQLQKTTPNRTLEESLPANLMQMLQDIQKRTHDLINGYNENESMPPATLVELDRLNKEMDHVIALLDSPISTVEGNFI